MKQIAFVIILLITSFHLSAQTAGELDISVVTSSTGGNYAPKNIVAIWIEDASGNFIKTISAYADKRIQYLYKWSASTSAKSSQYNRVDAVTGATLSNHGNLTGKWNGTDYNKNLVADGTYYVCFELTDKHAQGNYSRFAFTKGANNKVIPANTTGFSNILIQWTASVTTATKTLKFGDEIIIFPNPTKNIFHIKGENITDIEILNLAGSLIFKNNSTTRIDMSNFKSGIYLIRFKNGNQTIVKKLVKE